MTTGALEVQALIELLPTEKGGLTTPIRRPFRPNHNLAGPENRNTFIGEVDLPEGQELQPGESAKLTVTFMDAPGLVELLVPGRHWRIQAGGQLIGNGTVLKLL
jgi:translation elongation factor EF-Tu-like GTPase